MSQTTLVQQQQLNEFSAKPNYYNVVLNCPDLVNLSTIAKDYGWNANRLNKYLEKKGIQRKQTAKLWLLNKEYSHKGYTVTKNRDDLFNDFKKFKHTKVYWTQAGRLFIYHLLASDNIYPLIEQVRREN